MQKVGAKLFPHTQKVEKDLRVYQHFLPFSSPRFSTCFHTYRPIAGPVHVSNPVRSIAITDWLYVQFHEMSVWQAAATMLFSFLNRLYSLVGVFFLSIQLSNSNASSCRLRVYRWNLFVQTRNSCLHYNFIGTSIVAST